MLPVVRINACVVKDHGSFVSEPRMKVKGKDRYTSRSGRHHSVTGEPRMKAKGKDRYTSRSGRHHSVTGDVKRSSEEGGFQSQSINERGSGGSSKSITSINIPRDRVCTVNDLQLHLGGWYYLDGAGHEQGHLSFQSCKFCKQPKKEMEKYIHYSGKRARLLVDGSEEDYEMEELPAVQEECSFEDMCGDAIFHKEDNAGSENESGTWGLLDGHVLARVFNFLQSDVKSLVFAGLTCKHWRAVFDFFKDISRQVDLSSVGRSCTDSIIWKIMNGYKKEKITSLVLLGCTNISSIFRSHGGVDTHRDDSSGLRNYFESLDRRDSANQLFRRSLYKRSKLFDARRSSSILSRDAHLRRWAIKKSENSYRRMVEFLALGLKDIMKENTFDFFSPRLLKFRIE
ncbi:hypothetical protein Vadar_032471 [Vaccinium darrowii]|uniref:Uncharacterized protein n=1 Tax=Vaccinium darrowii TaxID=229202 RepID=A0ACB7Z7X7_9ERIC|nr:hypothetical protein Vadar_032471 [Vaccinium darrowii]